MASEAGEHLHSNALRRLKAFQEAGHISERIRLRLLPLDLAPPKLHHLRPVGVHLLVVGLDEQAGDLQNLNIHFVAVRPCRKKTGQKAYNLKRLLQLIYMAR